MWADVGAMHGIVTSGTPARFSANEHGMIVPFADEYFACACLDLRVAFQTKIVVAFNQQFPVDGTVGLMAGNAAFSERFVFKGERS